MLALAFWIGLAVVLCHACSLLEATLLSVRMSTLVAEAKAGSVGAARLSGIKRGRMSDAISAILTINTLAGTIGAGFAGVQAARLFGDAAVGIVSFLLTILLLMLAEIIPKTFASSHAALLAGAVGHILFYLMRIMAPVLFLTRTVTSRLSRQETEALTRKELAIIISAAPDEGAISGSEAELLASMVYAQNVTLRDVNTAADYVVMLDENATVQDFLDAEDVDVFSRIPIYRTDRANVVGYVLQREILKAAVSRKAGHRPLKEFAQPLPALPAELTIRAATDRLLHAHESMGRVVGNRNEFIGIVTVEDLLEALIGLDITDEPEDVAAHRNVAEKVRRQRIARLRRKTGLWANSDK